MGGFLCASGTAAVRAIAANAEGGPPYRRTTPRGSFGADRAELVGGVPGGPARGVASAPFPPPRGRTGFPATAEGSDPEIRAAFTPLAWYDPRTGRPRP